VNDCAAFTIDIHYTSMCTGKWNESARDQC